MQSTYHCDTTIYANGKWLDRRVCLCGYGMPTHEKKNSISTANENDDDDGSDDDDDRTYSHLFYIRFVTSDENKTAKCCKSCHTPWETCRDIANIKKKTLIECLTYSCVRMFLRMRAMIGPNNSNKDDSKNTIFFCLSSSLFCIEILTVKWLYRLVFAFICMKW